MYVRFKLWNIKASDFRELLSFSQLEINLNKFKSFLNYLADSKLIKSLDYVLWFSILI